MIYEGTAKKGLYLTFRREGGSDSHASHMLMELNAIYGGERADILPAGTLIQYPERDFYIQSEIDVCRLRCV